MSDVLLQNPEEEAEESEEESEDDTEEQESLVRDKCL